LRLDRELTCAEVVELVTAYLDGALSPRDTERFEEHLVPCDGCSAYHEQMRETIAETGDLSTADLPPALEERLLGAFRDWRRT
jgi:anti-sigma factor RsiW